MAKLASKVKSKADPFGFSVSPTSSRYDHSHGQPCVDYQDLRWKTTVRVARSGMTRLAQNTGGPGVRRWRRISEERRPIRGPTRPGLPRGGQGVYGSTPVPSAVM